MFMFIFVKLGNENISDLLLKFACLGDEEKEVLITFGAVHR